MATKPKKKPKKTPAPQKTKMEQIQEKMAKYRLSPILFIKEMWGLTPQPILPEFKNRVEILIEDAKYTEIKQAFFGPFEEGKNITWQQYLILKGIEKAMAPKTKTQKAQDAILNRHNKHPRRLSVRSGHGIGKAQAGDDIILTSKCHKKVKDVMVGDYLFGVDGKKNRVINKVKYSEAPMYKVIFSDKTSLDVSSGHLWTVKGRQQRRNGINEWKTVETIELYKLGVKRKNGKTCCRQWEIPTYNAPELKNRSVEIDPYIYGAWLGDGAKHTNKYSCCKGDLPHFLKEFSKYYEIGNTANKDGFSLLNFHNKFSKITNKADTNELCVNDRYKINSVDVRLAVLQGLLDTDGWVEKNGTTIGFVSVSEKLVDDVLWLARSLGFVARRGKNKKPFYYKEGKRKYCKVAYTASITNNSNYDLFRLKRKQELTHETESRYNKRWIESILPIESCDAYCFSCERPLYLANNFIVTHNSTTMSWLMIWFLFCFTEAKIPCTAPSQTQMFDVLWSEVKKWINRLPEPVQKEFDHQKDHVRMVYSPETAFARAKTAKKEEPEALAGMHADNLMMLIDEASGVPEEIFKTAEGALTEENILVVMISNATRLTGYFYESHHDDAQDWQLFHFPTTSCPRVTSAYEERIIRKYGKDSNEYLIRVAGEFPSAEGLDDLGYTPVFRPEDIKVIPDPETKIFVGRKILGIDPAGEGIDTTDWVIRDPFRLKIVAREITSTPESIARKTEEIMSIHNIEAEDVFIDSFGEGAKAAVQLAKDGHNINAVNVGDQCDDVDDKQLYINKRALIYTRFKRWARTGGEFVANKSWDEQVKSIKERRSTGRDRIQIMSKKEMRKLGYKSPNAMDAAALTFVEFDDSLSTKVETITKAQAIQIIDKDKTDEEVLTYQNKPVCRDPHAPI